MLSRPRHSLGVISLALLILFSLSLPLYSAKKRNAVNWQRKPPQAVRLAQMPVVVAKQKCENWAWAAALETMLRLQDAGIAQEYWIQRLNHGEVCLPRAGSFENLARFLESDFYVLDNGRKLRLQVQYRDGAPTSPDDLIVSVQRNQPIMMFWNGHPYLIAGVLYDEFIAPNGGRRFEVRELKLLDPYVNPKGGAATSSGRTIFESRREESEPNAECLWTAATPPGVVTEVAIGSTAPAPASGPPIAPPPGAPVAMDMTATPPTSEPQPAAEKPPCVPDDPRIVGFVKGRDNLAEIDGTFQVRVVWQ